MPYIWYTSISSRSQSIADIYIYINKYTLIFCCSAFSNSTVKLQGLNELPIEPLFSWMILFFFVLQLCFPSSYGNNVEVIFISILFVYTYYNYYYQSQWLHCLFVKNITKIYSHRTLFTNTFLKETEITGDFC